MREVQVRPRSFDRPLVVGTLYLDVETAELVRFRFSFTPAAVPRPAARGHQHRAGERAATRGATGFPYRQEIEIRRRASWLDFPARGIIRGRWEIEDYDLNVPLPPAVLRQGPAIGGLVRPQPGDSQLGPRRSRTAIAGVAAPINRAGHGRAPGRGRADRRRPGAERPSLEPARDRLAERPRPGEPGAGPRARLRRRLVGIRASRFRLRPRIGYGTSDDRVTGGLTRRRRDSAPRSSPSAPTRQIRDFSDLPVIAPVAQLPARPGRRATTTATTSCSMRRPRASGTGSSGRTSVELRARASRRASRVGVEATPANGTYRPNPPLGAGTCRVVRASSSSGRAAAWRVRRDLQGRLSPRGAGRAPATTSGPPPRAAGSPAPVAGTSCSRGRTPEPAREGSPPTGASCSAAGGRCRVSRSGRTAAEPWRWRKLEWRLEVPVPALPLGSFASDGAHR